MANRHTITDLYQMQSLPLDDKVQMTKRRIDDWVNSEEYIGVVKLKDFAWVVDSFKGEYKCAIPIFEVMSYSEDVKHFEVIGNIFDNKELLEREE